MAKLEAIAHGELPPGDDIDAVAARMMQERSLSWSCHARSAVLAGLVNSVSAGALEGTVDLWQRCDDAAAVVDFHTSLRVADVATGRSWVCETYFGGPPLLWRSSPGRTVRWRPARQVELCQVGAAGSVELAVSGADLSQGVRYRHVASGCTRELLRALCAVSVTHSAVAARPGARWFSPSGFVRVTSGHDGCGVVRVVSQPVRVHPSSVTETRWGSYETAFESAFESAAPPSSPRH
jgi:hypothetical protein